MKLLTKFNRFQANLTADKYGITIEFREGLYLRDGIEISGSANARTAEIKINVNRDAHRCWEVLFHEIGHVLDYRDGKYQLFYKKDAWLDFKSYEDLLRHRMEYSVQSVIAERSADSRGEALFQEMFPDATWNKTYHCARTLDVLWQSNLEYFKWVEEKYLAHINEEVA